MDLTALRHRTISHNMANADTPGYKRMDVSFSRVLEASYFHSFRSAASYSGHDVLAANGDFSTSDGNNVNLELEKALLVQNGIQYMAYVEMHERQMSQLRMAISGRVA